jgi:hypothetical protein
MKEFVIAIIILFAATDISAQPDVPSHEIRAVHAWSEIESRVADPTFDLSTIDQLPIWVDADISSDTNFIARQLVVKLKFQPQIIGGIVHVEAYVTPFFTGVGLANRPANTYTYAQAVDGIDHAILREIIQGMRKELEAAPLKADPLEAAPPGAIAISSPSR